MPVMTCILALIVSTGLFSSEPAQDQSDPDSKALFERLVKEAPRGWSELDAKCRKVRFSGRIHSTGKSRLPNGDWQEKSLSAKVEFKQNGLEHLFWRNEDLVRDGKSLAFGSSTALVANPKYTFVMKRPNANSLFFLEERSPLAESASTMRTLNAKRYMYLTMMWGNSGSTPFSELLRSKAFHLKKISKIDKGESTLIRIDYDHEADPAAKIIAVHDAWAVFDPDTHWMAKEFGYTAGKGLRYTNQYEYKQDDDKFPILQSSTYGISGEEGHSEFRLDYGTFEYADVPLSEFYTPSFGIDEPGEPAMTSGFISWSAVLLIVGCLFVLLAVVLRFRPTVLKWRSQRMPGHAV